MSILQPRDVFSLNNEAFMCLKLSPLFEEKCGCGFIIMEDRNTLMHTHAWTMFRALKGHTVWETLSSPPYKCHIAEEEEEKSLCVCV